MDNLLEHGICFKYCLVHYYLCRQNDDLDIYLDMFKPERYYCRKINTQFRPKNIYSDASIVYNK